MHVIVSLHDCHEAGWAKVRPVSGKYFEALMVGARSVSPGGDLVNNTALVLGFPMYTSRVRTRPFVGRIQHQNIFDRCMIPVSMGAYAVARKVEVC